jgi:hypothetical protein
MKMVSLGESWGIMRILEERGVDLRHIETQVETIAQVIPKRKRQFLAIPKISSLSLSGSKSSKAASAVASIDGNTSMTSVAKANKNSARLMIQR